MRLRYDAKAEQECELVILCKTCKKGWNLSPDGNSLNCPKCNDIRVYGYKCNKCKKVYVPKKFEPRICSKCHPELFVEETLDNKSADTAPKTLAQRIHESKVTYLSDEPKGANFTRELYDEWISKLDPNDRERLRDKGEDPYDPWR